MSELERKLAVVELLLRFHSRDKSEKVISLATFMLNEKESDNQNLHSDKLIRTYKDYTKKELKAEKTQLQNLILRKASELQQNVLVTDCQTLTVRFISCSKITNLKEFKIRLSVAFEKPPQWLQIYMVEQLSDDKNDPIKNLIDSENKFTGILEKILISPMEQLIYANFDSTLNSPTASISPISFEVNNTITNDMETSIETVSTVTDDTTSIESESEENISTIQFRKLLILRDGQLCRICKACDVKVYAVHIIETKYRLPQELLLQKYHLSGYNDCRNGILMCKTCHRNYKSFEIGIQPTGEIIYRSGLKNKAASSIYYCPDELAMAIRPSELALEFKYMLFISKATAPPPSAATALLGGAISKISAIKCT